MIRAAAICMWTHHDLLTMGEDSPVAYLALQFVRVVEKEDRLLQIGLELCVANLELIDAPHCVISFAAVGWTVSIKYDF